MWAFVVRVSRSRERDWQNETIYVLTRCSTSTVTTFSTYSVDLATWISQGKVGKAAAYVLTNNVGGIAAAATGLWLAQRFL